MNVTAMDFRNYDPAIGRFSSVDLLTEQAPMWTPYRFGFNNPVYWIDPSGLFETRKEARLYRKKHDISGKISKNDDGTFSIIDKENSIEYTKGDDSDLSLGDSNLNDGVLEYMIVSANSNLTNMERLDKDVNSLNSVTKFFYKLLFYKDAVKFATVADAYKEDPAKAQTLVFMDSEQNRLDAMLKSGSSLNPNSSGGAIITSKAKSKTSTQPATVTPTIDINVKGHTKTGQTITVSGQNREVIQGPNGGKYYINSNGNRVSLNPDGTKRN